MKILHVVPGLDEVGNGISVAAKLIAEEQGADLMEARLFAKGKGELADYDEVGVHSCWLPMTLKSCQRVLRAGMPLVRMTHANLDPVRLRYHGWKKWLVGPIERWCLRRCAKIVTTCEAEAEWIRAYEPRVKSIEVTDIKRFFNLNPVNPVNPVRKKLHLLYLGRRHPLKGLSYLETALATYYNKWSSAPSSLAPTTACADNPSSNPSRKAATYYNKCPIEFRVVSDAFGDELERVWDWCDVLVLPTLSENFGLVIAEALERGKCVITTDGAPAWGENLSRAAGRSWSSELELESGSLNSPVEHEDDGEILFGYDGRLIYLKGYRDGSNEQRVELLKNAIEKLCRAEHKG